MKTVTFNAGSLTSITAVSIEYTVGGLSAARYSEPAATTTTIRPIGTFTVTALPDPMYASEVRVYTITPSLAPIDGVSLTISVPGVQGTVTASVSWAAGNADAKPVTFTAFNVLSGSVYVSISYVTAGTNAARYTAPGQSHTNIVPRIPFIVTPNPITTSVYGLETITWTVQPTAPPSAGNSVTILISFTATGGVVAGTLQTNLLTWNAVSNK